MSTRTESVEVLDSDEALAVLAGANFGRLAFAIAGEPDIVPINYLVCEGKVYFRTAEGSKLLGVTVNSRVALEIDHVQGERAFSVVLHGRARELLTQDELEFAQSLPLRSWLPTDKDHLIEITTEDVTGRRFCLRADASSDAGRAYQVPQVECGGSSSR